MGMTQSDMITPLRSTIKCFSVCEHLIKSMMLKGYVPKREYKVFEKFGFKLDETDTMSKESTDDDTTDNVIKFVKVIYPEGWHISKKNFGRQILVIVDESENYKIGVSINSVEKKRIDVINLTDETKYECKLFKQLIDKVNKISSLMTKSYSPGYEYLMYNTYKKKNNFIGFVKSPEDVETIKEYLFGIQGDIKDVVDCDTKTVSEYSYFHFPEEIPSGFIESLADGAFDDITSCMTNYMMSQRMR